MWKGLLIGLAVGIGIGWLVFRGRGEPALVPPDASTSKDGVAPPALSAASPPPARVAAPAAGPSGPARDADALRTASADEMHRRWNASGNTIYGGGRSEVERLSAEEGRVLLERAKRALADRDGGLFVAAVRGLARADGHVADAFLLEVMSDASLPMPGPAGRHFFDALKDSTSPGIARAARTRFETEVAAGRDNWWGADGWLHLVAVHGDADAIAWLRGVARKGGEFGGQVRDKAMEALARSPSPEASAAFEAAVDQWSENALSDYLAADPERAVLFLERRLDGQAPTHMDRKSLWQTYARHAPKERLVDLERRILAAEGVRAKADAVYAMEALSRRDYDLTAFRGVVPSLLDWLSTHVAAAASDERSTVLYALEYNRVAWTRETLAVLERVAPESGAAKEIRAHLDHPSPWK